MRPTIILGHQNTDVATQQFSSSVAELTLGSVIERLNFTEVIDYHNSIDGGA